METETESETEGPVSRVVWQIKSNEARRSTLADIRSAEELFGWSPGNGEWRSLTLDQASKFRFTLRSRVKHSMELRILSAVRRVLKECLRDGSLSGQTYFALLDELKATEYPSRSDHRRRKATREEVRRIVKTCQDDNSPAGRRDAAIVTMVGSLGLRRERVTTMTLEDYRDTDVDPETGQVVDRWVEYSRGFWAGPLFCPLTRSGDVIRRAMTETALYYIVKGRIRASKVAKELSLSSLAGVLGESK